MRNGRRRTLQELAGKLGLAPRIIFRDIQRLRYSGVPIRVTGRRVGGASLEATTEPSPVRLDLAEVAALISSLTAVGPNSERSSSIRDDETCERAIGDTGDGGAGHVTSIVGHHDQEAVGEVSTRYRRFYART